MNIPNKLTLIRFLMVPSIITALYMQTEGPAYIALILLICAWLTDILDGYLAKRNKSITKRGAFFDPFVDKVLVSFVFIVLGDLKIMPMWLVLLMIFRDFATQAIRNAANSEGAILKSEWSGKIKFGLQMIALIFAVLLIALSYTIEDVRKWMYPAIFWFMIIVVIWSYYALFEFLYKNRRIIFGVLNPK